MEICYVRGMWGMDEGSQRANLERIATGGFGAVEMGIPGDADARAALKDQLAATGLQLIAQQWTGGDTPEAHAASYEQQYLNAVAQGDVLLVNSHSGKDHFTTEQNLIVLRRAAELEAEHGLPVVHEIHRGRSTFCAPALMALLDEVPELKLCADFSHWCCVHESFLGDQAERVERALQHAHHLHARVGHTQASQVPDPRAPEWTGALDAHLAWWDRFVELGRERGEKRITICPEFGPYPYMVQQPHTRQDIVDLWDVNLWIKELLAARYGAEATVSV